MLEFLTNLVKSLRGELAAKKRAHRAAEEARKRLQEENEAMRAWNGIKPFNGVLGGEIKPSEGRSLFEEILQRQQRARGIVTPRWAEEISFYEKHSARMIEGDGE